MQVTDLGAKLAAETSRADGASAERAAAAAELAALREAHAAELMSERQHFERQITEARAAQVRRRLWHNSGGRTMRSGFKQALQALRAAP